MLTQYSPRFGDAISADTDVMKTMRGLERRVRAPPLDLIARDRLRQEVRALQVRAQHLFEALLGRLEQIGADTRRAAGVVDERVDGAESFPHAGDQASAIVSSCEVAAHVVHRAALPAQLLEDVLDVGVGADAAERKVPAFARERARDTEADPAGAAGDERRRGSTSLTRNALTSWSRHARSGPKNVRYGAPSARRLT